MSLPGKAWGPLEASRGSLGQQWKEGYLVPASLDWLKDASRVGVRVKKKGAGEIGKE